MASQLVKEKIAATEKDFDALRGQFAQGLISPREYICCLLDVISHYKQELLAVNKEQFEDSSDIDKLYRVLHVLTAVEDYEKGITIPDIVSKLVKLVPAEIIVVAETMENSNV